jgi:hypothetical protein
MHTADVSISYSSGSSLQLRMYTAEALARQLNESNVQNTATLQYQILFTSASEASSVHSWGFAAFKLGTSRMFHRCLLTRLWPGFFFYLCAASPAWANSVISCPNYLRFSRPPACRDLYVTIRTNGYLLDLLMPTAFWLPCLAWFRV